MASLSEIDKSRLPVHIAIIMDGNGRWAKEKGESRLFGHYNGVESVRNVVEGCAELGIGYLTLYAFSTENWGRPEDEVNGLMALMVETIRKEVPTLNRNNIKLTTIGNTSLLPDFARAELQEAIDLTQGNTGLTLIVALSYSSRWEMLQAVQQISKDVKNNLLQYDEITEQVFNRYLSTGPYPDPELMIRTSGEYRISNFLLYQLAYAELYFTETRWPDFRKQHLYEAILNYQKRERRFGKTGEQIRQETSSGIH
ncbi:MAG: isoprenyl transferase [Chitinophagaceae bacterium]|nr:isoprenyl transferase [Chitinophagaceae bacterium]MCW5928596.1 isoprenyl transferase [Chitinophagaceae bacterium]